MFKEIKKESVVDTIVKQMSDAIISGQLKPGDKIPTENELMTTLGVGRNSVREAVKMLSAIGVLEIRRGDGTYIKDKVDISKVDILFYSIILEKSSKEQVLEARQSIEELILQLIVNKVSQEEIEMLSTMQQDLSKALSDHNHTLAANLDLKFHCALADLTKNPIISRMAKSIMELFHFSIKKTIESQHVLDFIHNNHHDNMIDILKTKDTTRIKDVIKDSLHVWKNNI
ncbi:FadR family transcriptional regulator [Vallitalea pronyensis]|uniref:FadR family transcriptional regulator n=1 Tax=Vallitalea pronyensis TaxID=1348613 RepID=A0A8J8SFR5_9FIRM|nr:GntR family transcriptional regulator [Vallitalea pronyensis]QUI21612.1 FadR family transcriptional regulator [Vallitalea pronyensis]